MKTKTYYLFGEQAVSLYFMDKTADEIKNSDHDTFCYAENVHQPSDLLDAFMGWTEYAEISEELYNELNKI